MSSDCVQALEQRPNYRFHGGQIVEVLDHAALDADGNPKVRTSQVRFVSKEKVLVYVPRYNAEVFFDKSTYLSENGRLEVRPIILTVRGEDAK